MNRSEMYHAVDDLMMAAKEAKEKDGLPPVVFVPKREDISDDEKLEKEYECLGFFITKNPLIDYKIKLDELIDVSELDSFPEKSNVKMGGLVTNIKEINTKAGKTMGVFQLEDLKGRVEVVLFPKMYYKFKGKLKKNAIVEIAGRLDKQVRMMGSVEIITPKILLSSIHNLEEAKTLDKIVLHPQENDDIRKIYDIITENPGSIQVELEYRGIILKTKYTVAQKRSVLNQLESLCMMRRLDEK